MISISGANSFVGSMVACAFLKSGHSVRAIIKEDEIESMKSLIHNGCFPLGKASIQVVPCNLEGSLNDWKSALKGTEYFMSIASSIDFTTNTEQYVKEILETNKKLGCAAMESGIRKMVFTSSTLTQDYCQTPTNEGSSIDASKVFGYVKGKLLSEQQALSLHAPGKFSVSSIVPSVVLGPSCLPYPRSTMGFITDILKGYMINPDISIPIIDVRCLGEAYVKCVEDRATDGKRIFANTGVLKLKEIACLLKEKYPQYNINTATLNMDEFDTILRAAPYYYGYRWYNWLKGKKIQIDNSKFLSLNTTLISPKSTIIDAAECCISKKYI